MIQPKMAHVTLAPEQVMNMEEIIINEDEQAALTFLKDTIRKKIIQDQLPYDPLRGTLGYRKNRYGYPK